MTRDWLLSILNKKMNLALAVGISSSLFGFMHLANNVTFLSILSIILFDVMLALYMLNRDNIWSVIGLHGAWNLTQGNIFGIAVSLVYLSLDLPLKVGFLIGFQVVLWE